MSWNRHLRALFSFFHPPVPCVGLLLLIPSPDTVTVGRRWIKMPEGAIPVGPEATLALLGFIYSLAPRLPPGVLAAQLANRAADVHLIRWKK